MNSVFIFIKRLFIRENKNKEIQNLNIQDLSLFYDLSNDDVFKEKNNQIILDLDLNDVFYKIDKTNSYYRIKISSIHKLIDELTLLIINL